MKQINTGLAIFSVMGISLALPEFRIPLALVAVMFAILAVAWRRG
jgi:hypothetical protein